MTLGEIIKEYRSNNKMSMDDFAEKSGLSKGYISMLERNKNPKTGKKIVPSLETIKSVASAVDKNFNEVFNLLGDQEVSLVSDGELQSNTKDSGQIDSIKIPFTKTVPILGKIAAGQPIIALEEIEGYLPVTKECIDFALRVQGDSMINARIFNGDLVEVQKDACIENGDIVVALVDSENATVKRFYKYGDKIILKPENPTMKEMEFDVKDVWIIGKVIAVNFEVH